MGILSFFRRRSPVASSASAATAKDRLQLVLAHERTQRAQPDYIPRLRREILDVIGRYVPVDDDRIHVHYENSGNVSRLELDIELPNAAAPVAVAS